MKETPDLRLVADELERHAKEERGVVDRYRELTDKCGDGPVAYLLDMILTDEELHHFQLETMAKWLREPATLNEREGLGGMDLDGFVKGAQELAAHEQQTIDACAKLLDRVRDGAPENNMIRALLEALSLDSRKHALLLSAIEKMVEKAR